LTNIQPNKYGSLSNGGASGKAVPSLIRIVPELILSGATGINLDIDTDTLFANKGGGS